MVMWGVCRCAVAAQVTIWVAFLVGTPFSSLVLVHNELSAGVLTREVIFRLLHVWWLFWS